MSLNNLTVIGAVYLPNISFFSKIYSRSSAYAYCLFFFYASYSKSTRVNSADGLAVSACSTTILSYSCQSVTFISDLILSRTLSRVSSDKFFAKYSSRLFKARYFANAESNDSSSFSFYYYAIPCISFYRWINLPICAF